MSKGKQKNELNDILNEFDQPKASPTVGQTLQRTETEANKKYANAEKARKELVHFYRNEEKVAVTISPFYRPYLGKVVRKSVNGIIVDVPADGKTYQINKTHADQINNTIRKIDNMIARQKRAGDIGLNLERTPGELHI